MTIGRVAVNRVHQIVDHAIGVDRRLVGGQPGQPLRALGLALGSDLRRDRRMVARAGLPELAADLRDQLPQDQLGVADDARSTGRSRLMSRASLVTCTSVFPGGSGVEKPPCAKLQPMPKTRSAWMRQWAAARASVWPPAPAESGMIFGEGALARHRRHDGHADQFGQFAQLVPSPPPRARRGRHGAAAVAPRAGAAPPPRHLPGRPPSDSHAPGYRRARASSTVAAVTSRGSSTSTGPRSPERSCANARRSNSGMRSAALMRVAHFVTVR